MCSAFNRYLRYQNYSRACGRTWCDDCAGDRVDLPGASELSARTAGDPARVDQLYRRWLAGMLPEDEKGLDDVFTARWRAKRRSIMLRQEND